MGITEILRRIWQFSANKIESSESVSKQPTQLIVELNSSLRRKLGTKIMKNNENYLRSVPGKSVFPVNISAIMQPTDQISTVW